VAVSGVRFIAAQAPPPPLKKVRTLHSPRTRALLGCSAQDMMPCATSASTVHQNMDPLAHDSCSAPKSCGFMGGAPCLHSLVMLLWRMCSCWSCSPHSLRQLPRPRLWWTPRLPPHPQPPPLTTPPPPPLAPPPAARPRALQGPTAVESREASRTDVTWRVLCCTEVGKYQAAMLGLLL
jgi:hypothetical protein